MDKNKPEGSRNRPSDLDGEGYSSKSYKPGYPLDKSLKGCGEDDLKRGFKNYGGGTTKSGY